MTRVRFSNFAVSVDIKVCGVLSFLIFTFFFIHVETLTGFTNFIFRKAHFFKGFFVYSTFPLSSATAHVILDTF